VQLGLWYLSEFLDPTKRTAFACGCTCGLGLDFAGSEVSPSIVLNMAGDFASIKESKPFGFFASPAKEATILLLATS
jgi:hypothetical protein